MEFLRRFLAPKRRSAWLEVLVDLDETLVFPEGLDGSLKLESSPLTYTLAHGGLEFLVALDRLPHVRVSFYSAGSPVRNEELLKLLRSQAKEKFGYEFVNLGVVLAPQSRPTKPLKGLREDLVLEQAILVDDIMQNAEPGEERNLLKVYERVYDETEMKRDSVRVYELRRRNNLVRALGMILRCLEDSAQGRGTPVHVLETLQRSGHGGTNSEEIYTAALKAMRDVNPNFGLVEDPPLFPWSN